MEKRLFRTFRLRVQGALNIVDKVQRNWKGEQGVKALECGQAKTTHLDQDVDRTIVIGVDELKSPCQGCQ